MRKPNLLFALLLAVAVLPDSYAATSRGGQSNAAPAVTSVAARAARSAVPTVSRGAGRSAVAPKTVSARVATTQKVINNGTKVASATANTAVSESCKTQYYGCMDSFCMLDNTSGGRCLCSDRNAELDSVLAEIQRLDEQSYAIATSGVERVEMGADADAVIAQANAIAQSFVTESKTSEKRRSLDLANWTSVIDLDDDDGMDADISLVEGKTGNALHEVVYDLCTNQIISESPECAKDMGMLKLMYAQQIRSDCTAYENSLKQQKNASTQKVLAAEAAVREAALEQYRNANKYDLGQCTVEFKKCMVSTGGCGNDFSSCATVSAMDNTNARYGKTNKKNTYSIKGATTTIDISKSTYDTLIAKKPLCETVTKSCVAVKDKVWDTFLKEVAPQLKSAELIAEDNLRQDCIGSISSCFQKACKDNIDPNDPDGSYDMCLTRPETMLNVCKIPLEKCGISTKSPESSNIWNFVVARLASMRVDSCTTQVKECLQSNCGTDYAECVGLDTDTIMRMCPYEKLVGCQMVYGEKDITGNKVYDEIANMVQGVMLSIDNAMLQQCQRAVDEAMIRVCGDTTNCNNLVVDNGVGSRSLEYKICRYSPDSSSMDINYNSCLKTVENITDADLGYTGNGTQGRVVPYAGVIDGTIYWGSVSVSENGKISSFDEYLNAVGDKTGITESQKQRIASELTGLQNSVDTAINLIESDPTVQSCITGKEVQGMRVNNNLTNIGDKSRGGRYPQLTQQIRSIISASALKAAKKNYYAKYDELSEKMLQDYAKIGERVAELQGKSNLDARREMARKACVSFADMSVLAMSPEPPKSAFGTIMAAVAIIGSVVAIPFTGGVSGTIALGSAKIALSTVTAGAVVAGGAATATVGLVAGANNDGGNGESSSEQKEFVGSAQNNQWNYKETVTSTFEWETLMCHKCTRAENCADTRHPLFGRPYCDAWEDPVETCTDTQF